MVLQKEEESMKEFNAEYVKVRELGTLSGNRKVDVGHYKDKGTGKAYADKVYITGTYSKRNGEECAFVNATGLTLEDLKEIRQIKID